MDGPVGAGRTSELGIAMVDRYLLEDGSGVLLMEDNSALVRDNRPWSFVGGASAATYDIACWPGPDITNALAGDVAVAIAGINHAPTATDYTNAIIPPAGWTPLGGINDPTMYTGVYVKTLDGPLWMDEWRFLEAHNVSVSVAVYRGVEVPNTIFSEPLDPDAWGLYGTTPAVTIPTDGTSLRAVYAGTGGPGSWDSLTTEKITGSSVALTSIGQSESGLASVFTLSSAYYIHAYSIPLVAVGAVEPPPSITPVTYRSLTNGPSNFATTVTLTPPAGNAAGDVILATIYLEDANDMVPPAGWTELVDILGNPPSSQGRVQVFWKRLTAPESSDWVFTHGGISSWMEGNCWAFDNCITTGDPFESFSTLLASGTSLALPSIAVSEGALLVGAVTNFNGGSWTPASGMTEVHDFGVNTAMAHQSIMADGASGIKTFTAGNSGPLLGFIGSLAPVPLVIATHKFKEWNGSSWVDLVLKEWNGSSWITLTPKEL